MYIEEYPIRFGFKIWIMCSASSYPYTMQLFSGKVQDKPAKPLGSQVVRDMLSVVKGPSEHSVFFDNFFTSVQLLEKRPNIQVPADTPKGDEEEREC